MNTTFFHFMHRPQTAFAVAFFVLSTGCVYVHPARRNPGKTGTYTRAESFPAERHLVDALFSDPSFAQHYAAKAAKNGGAVPVVQVSYIDNLSKHRVASLGAIRRDIEAALRSSGRFTISGDPDACDYILKGEYRDMSDGWRSTHKVIFRLHDTTTDTIVWTGTDEIAKQYMGFIL